MNAAFLLLLHLLDALIICSVLDVALFSHRRFVRLAQRRVIHFIVLVEDGLLLLLLLLEKDVALNVGRVRHEFALAYLVFRWLLGM